MRGEVGMAEWASHTWGPVLIRAWAFLLTLSPHQGLLMGQGLMGLLPA